MKKLNKSYSFLISALISLLSFIFTIAIALTLFTNAGELSRSSQNKTIAINMSQDIINEQKQILENADSVELLELTKNPIQIQDTATGMWDNKERKFDIQVTLEGEKIGNGVLVNIQVDVKGIKNSGSSPLVSLNTTKYVEF